MSFEDFISKKKTGVSDKLKKLLDEEKNKKFDKDERYWKPSVDKSGVGGAVIRFLPPPEGEEMPFVKYFHHAFSHPVNSKGGSWYIEKSRTTLGEDDPVSEYNREHWDEYTKEEQTARKRKVSYVSNIYVISDPLHPENEGKNFLFKYGVKIAEKLMNEVDPKESVVKRRKKKEPYEPWNFMTGADFIIDIKKKDGVYWSYDDSEFDERGPLILDEDASEEKNIELLKELYNNLYSLQEIIDTDSFKSYEQLKTRFNTVLGLNKKSSSATNYGVKIDDDGEENIYENDSEEQNVMDDLVKEYNKASSSTDEEDDEDEEVDDELKSFAGLLDD